SPATPTAPTAALVQPTTRQAPESTKPRWSGLGCSASIRPIFFRTTTPPVSLPGSAISLRPGQLAPTSTIFAPLSLTAPNGSPIPAPRQVKRLLFPLLPLTRALLVAAALMLLPGTAHADFHLCNNTGSRVGIAVGYKDPEGAWVTEGW